MAEKSVLLIIGGGIAAYKSLDLIRRLAERGIVSRAILTRAGAEFVTPLSVSALSGEKTYTDLFDLTDETEMGHIELSRSADLIVVAPATADLMAKAANGLANDLASTALLATDKPVMMAPAMNVRMWEHPATRRNFETLKRDGVTFVGPDDGAMACGEFGPGRMAEPLEIASAVMRFFNETTDAPLAGKHVLVTAGPTQEPIDPVRYIGNRSSGKQGYAVAGALARLGADVTLVSGPVALDAPAGVDVVRVRTAEEMLAAVEAALPADAGVFAAAVADYRPIQKSRQKVKKDAGGMAGMTLRENPDILATVARSPRRPALLVGFAAETEKVVEHARAKRLKKGCDWIVANDVSAEGGAMGGDDNAVHLITAEGVEDWPRAPKRDIAEQLARRIAEALTATPTRSKGSAHG